MIEDVLKSAVMHLCLIVQNALKILTAKSHADTLRYVAKKAISSAMKDAAAKQHSCKPPSAKIAIRKNADCPNSS